MRFSLFWISLLGWLGVFSRYGIKFFFKKKNGNFFFPFSILLINIVGSFFAGVVYRNIKDHLPQLYGPLMIGFLGGFTTFSSYSLKTLVYFQEGEIYKALAYFLLSPLLGLIFCYLGFLMSR